MTVNGNLAVLPVFCEKKRFLCPIIGAESDDGEGATLGHNNGINSAQISLITKSVAHRQVHDFRT